jgi:alpha-glucosidase (family GH31 glycosyl hydrolase)
VIRHRPLGRGHAYQVEPDQRHPVVPVAGTPLTLGATTSAEVDAVVLELVRNGLPTSIAAAAVDEGEASPALASDTHLAAAAARRSSGRRAWQVTLDGLAPGDELRYRFAANGGTTRWHDVAVAGWRVGDVEVRGEPADRLVAGSVQELADGVTVRAVRFELRLQHGEHVVGFGERFDRVDQRGSRLDSVVFEQYKGQGARTYLPTPFAIVPEGRFGFHVATGARVWFDVGASAADRLVIVVDDAAPVLHLFAGSPDEVLRAFLDATAPPALPPAWVFGPWMSGNEWNTQERVLAEVARSEREGIPASVVVIEAWSDEQTFTAFRDAEYPVHEDGGPHHLADFRFPPDGAWPDPVGMVETLHAKGIRVLLWQIPLLKTGAPLGSQLACDRRVLVERGYAVGRENGRPYANRGWWFPRALMPDFTSAEATRWWTEKRRYLVDEVGIDGFKTDGGEHAWGADLRYADGTSGGQTNNRYPVLYAQAYHDLLRASGVDGITFSRAGYTGAAAVPCHWAGDEDSTWEAFRASVVAGITAGASGVFFWGWDIAGFSGEIPSAELYLRAAAMACFCPIMQYHSEYNHHRSPSRDRTPWNIAERTGDERALTLYRRFARLRMRLAPYLEAEAGHSVDRRTPLMKGLFFAEPDDARAWDFPYQYLLGRSLLVAPVVEPGAEKWDVYLPEGEWVDVWGEERLRGSRVVSRAVPLEVIPVFAAASGWEALRHLFNDPEEG